MTVHDDKFIRSIKTVRNKTGGYDILLDGVEFPWFVHPADWGKDVEMDGDFGYLTLRLLVESPLVIEHD